MPDCAGDQSEVARLIFSLPCHVKLPKGIRDRFEKAGLVQTIEPEARRFPRAHCLGTSQRAALEYRQTFPALPRENVWFGVYVIDISRGGCRFLHCQLLYPGEQLRLVPLTGVGQIIEVKWCRRIDEQCFEAGGQYASPLEWNALDFKKFVAG